MANRKKIPEKTETKVLLSSARRCALCFGLNGDLERKKGQIAHIDKDPSNANESNLVYLCLDHHDEYDSKTSQTKNVTSRELSEYKQRLITAVKNGDLTKSETKDTQNVRSMNQRGGITVGQIGTININPPQSPANSKDANQLKRDGQTALLYQTEISHFLHKFKTCLHWTLPLVENIDTEVDAVFNYGINFAKAIDLDKVTKILVANIFKKYDFAKPMANFYGENNIRPTGFNNVLGILKYLDHQLEKQMNKYGGSTSTELTSRIEYMQRMVQSLVTSIRLDLGSKKNISVQTADLVADVIVLMCRDFQIMRKAYTKGITGDFPIVAGKVTKSHKTEGSISVETQFSEY